MSTQRGRPLPRRSMSQLRPWKKAFFWNFGSYEKFKCICVLPPGREWHISLCGFRFSRWAPTVWGPRLTFLTSDFWALPWHLDSQPAVSVGVVVHPESQATPGPVVQTQDRKWTWHTSGPRLWGFVFVFSNLSRRSDHPNPATLVWEVVLSLEKLFIPALSCLLFLRAWALAWRMSLSQANSV